MEKNSLVRDVDVIFIGGSAGSLSALLTIFSRLHAPAILPIVIIVHRKVSNDSLLENLLSSRTHLRVKEAEEKETLQKNNVYIAPADYHLLIEKQQSFSLDGSEKVNYSRPSIDVSFESGQEAYGARHICILLSGANADGVAGMKKSKAAGALTIAQDPQTAEVPFMPHQAVVSKAAKLVLSPEEIGDFINDLQ